MVEVDQRDSPFVKPLEGRSRPLEDLLVDALAPALGQWPRVDPLGRQSEGTEAPEEGGQARQLPCGPVGRSYAAFPLLGAPLISESSASPGP